MPFDVDVVIIGAGAAGLAAARNLSGRGVEIALVEARDRIGGRIHTLHPPGAPAAIELGAEFVHGDAPEAFEIVNAAALLAIELPDDHWWSSDGTWRSLPDFWDRISRVRRKVGVVRKDVPLSAFLDRRRDIAPFDRELFRTFVEGYHAADGSRISTLSLAESDAEQEEGRANRQFRIFSGYDAIPRWLHAGIDPGRSTIRLSTVVTTIHWTRGEVRIMTKRVDSGAEETIRARAAIITVPIGVLKAAAGQAGRIEFDPSLPSKTKSLANIESGHVVKIVFQFDEAFWDSDAFRRDRGIPPRALPLNFIHSAGSAVPTWWTAAPARAPLLTAWAGGPAADRLLAGSRDSLADRALEDLARTFRVPRGFAERQLLATYTHDWQADPFSRGAYSWATVGGSGANDALARPVQGTLFFGGEATTSAATGTVAGAIESGQRAAREVLRHFRR